MPWHTKLTFKIILTTSVILYILIHLNLHLLQHAIQKLSFPTIFTASLFCFFSSFCQALRWYVLTKRHLPTTFFEQIRIFWQACFFNLMTPASLGGDVYRICFSQKNNGRSLLLGLILRERLLGLIGIFIAYILFLFFLFIHYPTRPIPSFFLIGGFFSILGLIILTLLQAGLGRLTDFGSSYIKAEWKESIVQISKALHYTSYFELAILISLTLLSTLTWVIVFYLLANNLSFARIPLVDLGLVSILTELVRWIPITIQGIGLREGTAVYSFSILGHSLEAGFLISGLAYFINTLVLCCLALISFLFASCVSYKFQISFSKERHEV